MPVESTRTWSVRRGGPAGTSVTPYPTSRVLMVRAVCPTGGAGSLCVRKRQDDVGGGKAEGRSIHRITCLIDLLRNLGIRGPSRMYRGEKPVKEI